MPLLRTDVRLRDQLASSHPPASSGHSCLLPLLPQDLHQEQHSAAPRGTRAPTRGRCQNPHKVRVHQGSTRPHQGRYRCCCWSQGPHGRLQGGGRPTGPDRHVPWDVSQPPASQQFRMIECCNTTHTKLRSYTHTVLLSSKLSTRALLSYTEKNTARKIYYIYSHSLRSCLKKIRICQSAKKKNIWTNNSDHEMV